VRSPPFQRVPILGSFRRRLKGRRSQLLLAAIALCLIPSQPGSRAQQLEPAEKATRKLLVQIQPEYPADLKRASIGGVVRLDIVVAAAGRVDNIVVAGGNPILAESAVRAVRQWKYAPASSPSTIRVNLRFNPHP